MGRPTGRPSKLTKQVQEAMCLAIRTTKLSLSDCAETCNLLPDTVWEWMKIGKKADNGPYREFYLEVKKARADGSKMLLARIAKAGTDPKHWQANATLLTMTEPQYQPKVRFHVEEQLQVALDALAKEFEKEPEILQRAMKAISESDQHKS